MTDRTQPPPGFDWVVDHYGRPRKEVSPDGGETWCCLESAWEEHEENTKRYSAAVVGEIVDWLEELDSGVSTHSLALYIRERWGK